MKMVFTLLNKIFVMFEKMGCKFKNNKFESRPTFCCMKDKEIDGLYWAIPTSKITENKNLDRINKYINMKRGIGSCYYHIGYTNYPAIYCISSAFPITEKYIDREYKVNGKHLVIKNKQQIQNIRKKLKEFYSLKVRMKTNLNRKYL